MNTEQRTALTSAIQILSNSGGHYSTRDTIYTLRCMLDNDNGDELRSTSAIRECLAIEHEVLSAALIEHNDTMQKIGKARSKQQMNLAGAYATQAMCHLGDRLTRTTSLLSRLADGRK